DRDRDGAEEGARGGEEGGWDRRQEGAHFGHVREERDTAAARDDERHQAGDGDRLYDPQGGRPCGGGLVGVTKAN
ncbi:hypothetical protein THAOC_25979, partial [Thalassiosira oceanica]